MKRLLDTGRMAATVILLLWGTIATAGAQTIFCQNREINVVNFSSPVLVSGTDRQVGAVYRYANVTLGVDALVEIRDFTNGASINVFDNDAGGAANGIVDYFQPELNATGNESSAGFRITFVTAGTSTPVQLDIAASAIDVDGNSVSIREYVEYSDTLVQVVLNNPTALAQNASGPSGPGLVRYEATTFDVAPGIDPTAVENIVTAFFTDISSLDYRIGSLGPGAQTRLTSLGFNCPNLTTPAPQPVVEEDFGDAPLSYGSPVHTIVDGISLGAINTVDTGPFDSPTATGDSGDDGVALPGSFSAGQSRFVNLSVQGGTAGFLQGWIDWNRDGDFDDLGERIATEVQDSDADGTILLSVTAPAIIGTGQTFARFRWSRTAGLGPRSGSGDGEVEDYTLNLVPPGPAPTCPAGRSLLGQAGNAVSFVQNGVVNPDRALGALSAQGTTPPDPASAELNGGGDLLTLDLGTLAAGNSTLTLSLGRDGGAAGDSTLADILVSTDNGSYTSIGTYGAVTATFPSVVQDVLERIQVTLPASGARYVRFDTLNGDDLFVDGVQYAFLCAVGAELEAAKTVRTFDPLAEGLYAVPGNDVVYEITVTNRGAGATDNGTMLLIDRVPDDVTFFNGDVDGPTLPETGVVAFINGGSGLSFTPATDLAFSNAATQPSLFSQCTYVPAPGYDPAVTHVCLNPKGAMAAGDPDPFFRVEFRARIK